MNKVWSELNKTMQTQIKKKDTYKAGIDILFDLRKQNNQTTTSNFPCNFNFTVSNMNRFN